jgi:hypothetical protein
MCQFTLILYLDVFKNLVLLENGPCPDIFVVYYDSPFIGQLNGDPLGFVEVPIVLTNWGVFLSLTLWKVVI